MVKTIWFRLMPGRDGRDIPVYFKKGYKKARVKRASERLAPGHWEQNVARTFEQWYEMHKEEIENE